MKSNKGRTDIEGLYFGRLKVLFYYDTGKDRRARWFCECACGNFKVTNSGYLLSGKTKSCGCFKRDKAKEVGPLHTFVKTRLYRIYHDMIQRCNNPKRDRYKSYGGRGINICEEWLNNPLDFFTWALNSGYDKNLTIDRINNDGPYSPENCRWITKAEQNNNTQRSHFITFKGETRTVAQWAKHLNICRTTLSNRLRRGWSEERSLTT